MNKICKRCGKSYEPWRQAKGSFCSRACYFDHKHANRGFFAKERAEKIVALYRQGLSIKPIAVIVRTTTPRVKEILKQAGVYDPNRIQPQHVKGHRRLSLEVLARRIIAQHYEREVRTLGRFDELNHWRNHPEAKRWVGARVARSQYYKWRPCPAITIKRRLRSRVNRVLRGKLKSAPTLTVLGCSLEQFKSHLESQFVRGMNWNNYGRVWHIDHKEPCSSFDLSKPSEQRRCFHYSNLQPLPARENRCKHTRIFPTQLELLISLNESELSRQKNLNLQT